MKRLSRARFNLFALGSRLSIGQVILEELSYWADEEEMLIGVVFYDLEDKDYGWIMLCRDAGRRFRNIGNQHSIRTKRLAEKKLKREIYKTSQIKNLVATNLQGYEENVSDDILVVLPGTDPTKLHPYFRNLLEDAARAPARAVISEISPWLMLSDPHFIEEFQRHQFDQRLWELYLWAVFRELNFDVQQLTAPDFLCTAPGMNFTVEATTVAPSTSGALSTHPDPQNPDELEVFLNSYMAIKFGSSLTSKLNKKTAQEKHYWELEKAINKPFIFAIADFHKPGTYPLVGSMVYTQAALWRYLYGQKIEWELNAGKVKFVSSKVEEHSYNEKTIPSGFFELPDARYVSAIMFSNAGTIAKFDRMGITSGFDTATHKYLRVGERYDPDPNAVKGIPFVEDVSDPSYEERWSDELHIFHNPNALIPLPREWFQSVNQHYIENGILYSDMQLGTIINSYTMGFEFEDDQLFLELKKYLTDQLIPPNTE